MKIITIVLTDRDEEMLNRLQPGGDPKALIEVLVARALKEAVRDRPIRRDPR